MNWLKHAILTVAGFVMVGRLVRALHAGGPRPLQDIPMWQLWWVLEDESTEGASREWIRVYYLAKQEIALRNKMKSA